MHQIEEMPVLEFYSNQISPDHFKNTIIVYINHLISDSLMTARALRNCGAELRIICVPYGDITGEHRNDIAERLSELGKTIIPLISNPLDFDKEMEYAVRQTILETMDECKASKKNFLIVEDGGYAFPLLHDSRELKPALKFCIGAVEHTLSGMRNYCFEQGDSRGAPRIVRKPAISIATSLLKEKHEPAFIAQAAIEEISHVLRKRHEFLIYKTVVVLGYGRIGKAIAKALSSLDCDVIAVDPEKNHDEGENSLPNIQFLKNISDGILNRAHIVVGATGLPSLELEHLKSFLYSGGSDRRPHELILISVSSKQTEFIEVMRFLERCNEQSSLTNVGIEKKTMPEYGTSYTITLQENETKVVTLLGNGYPITFFPDYTDAASNRSIDPIMTELFLASCLMKVNHKRLTNKVHEIHDLPKLRLVDGPWNDLFNELEILRLWCRLNNLDDKKYFRKINLTISDAI